MGAIPEDGGAGEAVGVPRTGHMARTVTQERAHGEGLGVLLSLQPPALVTDLNAIGTMPTLGADGATGVALLGGEGT